MIEFLPESSGTTLGVKAGGTLTDADYRDLLIPRLESLFEQHRKVDLLFYMDESFKGWSIEAAWDDATLGLKHRADFDKIAVVGGPGWVDRAVKLFGFVAKGEVKTFPAGQLDSAWQWVNN